MTLCIEIDKNKKSETLDTVSDEGIVVIKGFMRKRLKLEKTELMVYAIIYGFHSSGSYFTSGLRYLCDWSGSGRSAVKAALASLVEKGYIIKRSQTVNNITHVEYTVNDEVIESTLYVPSM